jgi:dihydroorotate dehydrogenase (fumarate)/dihydroorotate dehydrogenase
MGIYSRLISPLAFRRDAEETHNFAIHAAERAGSSRLICGAIAARYVRQFSRLATTVAGIPFRNPLGLAAGYDKNGRGIPLWAALGFGHIEIGSVSADPSCGNPKPRLWRIPDDRGIIVNYGLPNDGADAVAVRLRNTRTTVPLGINIVNTNHGPHASPESDDAIIDDYIRSIRRLDRCASYLMLNLSCPNTADGRAFVSDSCRVRRLFEAVHVAAPVKPVFLKVAPFPDVRSLEAFLEQVDRVPVVRGFGINLPPGKPAPLKTAGALLGKMPGAVSGLPCRDLMDGAGAELYRRMNRKRHCLIATGGVFDAAGAYRKIRLGASLVQILTALIYEGPGIVRRIAGGLDELLARDGFTSVSDAVGADIAAI